MARISSGRSRCRGRWAWRRRRSDAGDLELVDDIGHAGHIAHQANELFGNVDRFDLAGEEHLRSADRDADPVAGWELRTTQRLDHVGSQLVVTRRLSAWDLDAVLALQFGAGIVRGARDVRVPVLPGHDHALHRRLVGDPLLDRDDGVVGDSRGRLVDEVAGVFGWQWQAIIALVHDVVLLTATVRKPRAASITP